MEPKRQNQAAGARTEAAGGTAEKRTPRPPVEARRLAGTVYGISCAIPGRLTAPGPGRSPFASTVALNDGGMQKALVSVEACGFASARQAFAGVPIRVISCSSPVNPVTVANAPQVRCLHVPQALALGQPVTPVQFAFEVQATGGVGEGAAQ